jgi:hypothetical protein
MLMRKQWISAAGLRSLTHRLCCQAVPHFRAVQTHQASSCITAVNWWNGNRLDVFVKGGGKINIYVTGSTAQLEQILVG